MASDRLATCPVCTLPLAAGTAAATCNPELAKWKEMIGRMDHVIPVKGNTA